MTAVRASPVRSASAAANATAFSDASDPSTPTTTPERPATSFSGTTTTGQWAPAVIRTPRTPRRCEPSRAKSLPSTSRSARSDTAIRRATGSPRSMRISASTPAFRACSAAYSSRAVARVSARATSVSSPATPHAEPTTDTSSSRSRRATARSIAHWSALRAPAASVTPTAIVPFIITPPSEPGIGSFRSSRRRRDRHGTFDPPNGESPAKTRISTESKERSCVQQSSIGSVRPRRSRSGPSPPGSRAGARAARDVRAVSHRHPRDER